MKGVCLICEKRREGIPINEGPVIKTIRAVKRAFGIAKGTTLVICPECWEEYNERRAGFEKSILIWTIIGIIIALALIVPPILFGDWNVFNIFRNIVMSIILIAVLLALIGLVRYIPKTTMTLEEYEGKGKAKGKAVGKKIRETTKRKAKKSSRKKKR